MRNTTYRRDSAASPAALGLLLGSALSVAGCTLQDFDALGSAVTDTGGSGGSLGSAGDAGSAGSAGSPVPNPDAGGSSEPVNLMSNPGFEATGHAKWTGFGNSTIIDSVTNPHSGQRCIGSTSRTAEFEGPSYDALAILEPGHAYVMSAWLRTEADDHPVQLTVKTVCDGAEGFITTGGADSINTEWKQIIGTFFVPECVLTELRPYFEGPAPGAVFYIDDVILSEVVE